MQFFRESMLELIIHTSTNLPPDVRQAMSWALKTESPGTQSGQALTIIGENIDMAADAEGPICQDTGMPTFEIKTPVGVNQLVMKKQILDAVAEATKRGKLRPNSVDSVTGKNSGNNLGTGTPILHFEQWEEPDVEVRLILKGGGCENTNAQYSVPAELDHLGRADRNLQGVKKCVLHAVWKAQGQGCAPGAVGVCIGSDRAGGYHHAKLQLFRTLDDVNPEPTLAKLEAEIMDEANKIGVGTMGFGGKVSLIGCKIAAANRLPASFFVSVAYDCWAYRRLGVLLDANSGAIKKWLYRDPDRPIEKLVSGAGFQVSGREIRLETPLTEEKVLALKVGDVVLINGPMVTGRDAAHTYLLHHEAPCDLRGAILHHCGPVMLKDGERWYTNAAGPTTSIREEPYEADIIKRFGLRAVMG
ncbi:MAG: fumarate hydratase, partial [Acidobacteria bacterium]|nr:fumarate hydratase [Acidobacteriota bacterium]